jgi:hypothetical protein
MWVSACATVPFVCNLSLDVDATRGRVAVRVPCCLCVLCMCVGVVVLFPRCVCVWVLCVCVGDVPGVCVHVHGVVHMCVTMSYVVALLCLRPCARGSSCRLCNSLRKHVFCVMSVLYRDCVHFNWIPHQYSHVRTSSGHPIPGPCTFSVRSYRVVKVDTFSSLFFPYDFVKIEDSTVFPRTCCIKRSFRSPLHTTNRHSRHSLRSRDIS